MSSGPDHYERAESLMESAWTFAVGEKTDMERATFLALMASTHAQLAAVAASVDWASGRERFSNVQDWKDAIEA